MPRSSAKSRRFVRASRDVARNARDWNRTSAAYDRKFASVLGGRYARTWGLWRIPESRTQYLGRVRGERILELGCGAARWSLALRRMGGRPIGLDLSREQLRHARTQAGRRPLPLVRASAHAIPFADRSFELVFCDWGALTFTDPYLTIPECARVLKPGGRLVFATSSPFRFVTHDAKWDRLGRQLIHPYFGRGRLAWRGGAVEFVPTYGEWIGLFRQHHLTVERLVETRPRANARTRYLSVADAKWGRSWPIEVIWSLRREPEPSRPTHR
ncbi:MAG: class I SAM-dependent methyltransferase [Thermoplasmata archaeon]